MSNITTYDQIREHLQFLQDSYKGGYSYKYPSALILAKQTTTQFVAAEGKVIQVNGNTYNTYLIPHEGESDEKFSNRLKTATYLNLCEPIVSAYVDSATNSITRNLNSLSNKLDFPVDYQGTKYEDFIQQSATEFAVNGFSFVLVTVDDLKLPKFTLIDPTKVAYIITDDFGELIEFAFINQSQIVNENKPSVQNIILTRITKESISVNAGQVDITNGYSAADLELISEIPLPASLGGKLPIVIGFFERDTKSITPLGISLIETQADIAKKVYNLQSYSFDILQKHFPQLVYPLSKERGLMPTDAQKAVGTGVALTYNSDTNAPSYISPSSESTDAIRQECEWLIEEAYKEAKMSKDSSSVPQSGLALRLKSRDFENAVKRFAKQIKSFELALLELTAKMTGEDFDSEVSINEKFSMQDVSETLQNAITLISLSNEIGAPEEVKKELFKYVLDNALPLQKDKREKIYEILDTTKSQVDLNQGKKE